MCLLLMSSPALPRPPSSGWHEFDANDPGNQQPQAQEAGAGGRFVGGVGVRGHDIVPPSSLQCPPVGPEDPPQIDSCLHDLEADSHGSYS